MTLNDLCDVYFLSFRSLFSFLLFFFLSIIFVVVFDDTVNRLLVRDVYAFRRVLETTDGKLKLGIERERKSNKMHNLTM